jgi:hypothetical protein
MKNDKLCTGAKNMKNSWLTPCETHPKLWKSMIRKTAASVLRFRVLLVSVVVLFSAPAFSQEKMSMEKAAQKSNNPVSDAWLLVGQSDNYVIDTPDGKKLQNSFTAQPVMPVPIFGGDWNLVNRVITGVVSAPFAEDFDSADPYGQRTTGNTDTIVFSLVAPNRDDGWIWGLGPTFILPTATQDVLGQEQWQAGPAGLLVRLGQDSGGLGLENWNIGVLAQHWWDFSGDSDRAGTSQSNIQYFINWKKDALNLIGMTPNIEIDWKKSGSDRFAVPIGLGTIGFFRIGKVPVRWGVEMQYYALQPDPVGKQWNLKLFIAPVAANPFK